MVEVGEGTSGKSLVAGRGRGCSRAMHHCEDVWADQLLSKQRTHATHRAMVSFIERWLYAKCCSYTLSHQIFILV